MKLGLIAIVFLAGCSLQTGWDEVRCYHNGNLVYSGENTDCPEWAGQGYSELQSGEIIQAECRCTSDL